MQGLLRYFIGTSILIFDISENFYAWCWWVFQSISLGPGLTSGTLNNVKFSHVTSMTWCIKLDQYSGVSVGTIFHVSKFSAVIERSCQPIIVPTQCNMNSNKFYLGLEWSWNLSTYCLCFIQCVLNRFIIS